MRGHRSRRTTVRRATLTLGALLAIAGTAPVWAATGESAKPAPGSGLGSVSINALAAAVRAPLYSNSGEDVEGEVPFASSQLSSGLQGQALTSVAWPGSTGANGGSTLYLLGPQCVPPNPTGVLPLPCPTTLPQGPQSFYNKLNDPQKAQAQTGAGKPTDTNSTQGIKQTATAKPDLVSAQTAVTGASAPAVSETMGKTAAATTITVTGPKSVVVTASSTVHDVALAGGLIKLGTVSSIARATSDTKTGQGHAETTVSDASIAGVPVTIDSSGVHLKGKSSALPATSAVNKALKSANIQVFVAKPTKQVKGANVSVDSGNLIVLFGQSQYVKQGNDTGTLLVLGGASITANTGKGVLPPPTIVPPPTPGKTPPASHAGGGSAPVSTGGGGAGSVPTGGSVTSGGQKPAVAEPTPQLAAAGIQLPGGLALIWVILGLMAAGGLAFAMKRLPDRMLDSPATACPLEDAGP